MFKITKEQKKEFYKLYKQGHRGEFISKVTGVSYSYAKKVVRSFDSGDFSWLNHSFRHFENVISEEEKRIIVRELSSTSMSWSDAVSKYGFSEDTLRRWKRNYNKYGVCSRKRGRPVKDGSHDKRSEENQIAARRDYYLQDVLPGLRGKRDGSSKTKMSTTV